MKIKLCDAIIDSSKIKQIHNRSMKLHSGLNKTIKVHYAIEFIDGNFKVITKQEYKMLKKMLKNMLKESEVN